MERIRNAQAKATMKRRDAHRDVEFIIIDSDTEEEDVENNQNEIERPKHQTTGKAQLEVSRKDPPSEVNFIIIDSDPEDEDLTIPQKDDAAQSMPGQAESQGEPLKKDPPTGVDFIIIDSDPEEEEPTRPPRKERSKKTAQRFYPVPKKKRRKISRSSSERRQVMKGAATTTESNGFSTAGEKDKIGYSMPHNNRGRTPQPYHGDGARRVEFFRPTMPFRREHDYNYNKSRIDAAAEQERLFQEAAERMKQKQRQIPLSNGLPTQPANMQGPTFAHVVLDVYDRFPAHWTWKNPFACLGLPPNASLAAAKIQYRTLVRCYHPDKSKKDTSNKFHAVVRAFHKVRQLIRPDDDD